MTRLLIAFLFLFVFSSVKSQDTETLVSFSSDPLSSYFVDGQYKVGQTPDKVKINLITATSVYFYRIGYYSIVTKAKDITNNQLQVKLAPHDSKFKDKNTYSLSVKEIIIDEDLIVQGVTFWNKSYFMALNKESIQQNIERTLTKTGIKITPQEKSDSSKYYVTAKIKRISLFWAKYNPGLVQVTWTLYDTHNKRKLISYETFGLHHGGDVTSVINNSMIDAAMNFANHESTEKYLLIGSSPDLANSSMRLEKITIPKINSIPSNTYSDVIKNSIKSTVTISTDLGHGSGFIISSDGYIITNKHVIEGVKEIEVIFSNGYILYPKVIQTSDAPDLALLKVDGKGFNPFSLNAPELEIGDELIVIGTPKDLSLGQTVTKGIVSGTRKDEDGVKYLQTDASINGGNSGGPILNNKGEVVGIATLKRKEAEGISFGILISEIFKPLNIVVE